MKLYKISYILILLVAWGCDISNNDIEPTRTFVKIYDDNRFEQEYFPLDVIQTSDDGFLILSEIKFDQSLFSSVTILKTDAMGNVVSSTQMSEPYAHPVNGWCKMDNQYYFICMNANTLISQLVAVDMNGAIAEPISIGGLTYPLVATVSDNKIVLQSFDNANAETVLSVVSATGQIEQSVAYTIGSGVDVEKPIIDHLTRNGNELPFAVGTTAEGLYYFNGFYNYTFSLVFTKFGTDPEGVCQGQLSKGGISAVASFGNNVFGVSRFNFGANYINPIAAIPTNSITSSTDLGGNTFPVIETGARVKLVDIGQDNSWLYGTHTQSKQIVLYGFNKDDGNILGTDYMGGGNPYSFASLTLTSDGGIAILARTALEGRFQRIALFKRDADYLNALILK